MNNGKGFPTSSKSKRMLYQRSRFVFGREKLDEKELISTLVRAHSLFMEEREAVEFTVAKEMGNTIRFLIVDGRSVGLHSPMAKMPLDGKLATPMTKALGRQVGTIIGTDYKGRKVLAAYTYTVLGDQTLGLVAKVDLIDIKQPFIKANGIVLAFGTLLTIMSVWLFFKISDPILQDLQESEENYRAWSKVQIASSFGLTTIVQSLLPMNLQQNTSTTPTQVSLEPLFSTYLLST